MNAALATRLGITVHVSSLLRLIDTLHARYPTAIGSTVEDWMLDLANDRGATVVTRPDGGFQGDPPDEKILSNEELVAAMLSPACRDRPEILRPAAQLISRGALNLPLFENIAVRERIERVLGDLSRQALRAEPEHRVWRAIHARFGGLAPLRDTLLHWTRLAEPIMKDGRCNAAAWKLVA
jgi:hypothetical protein